MGESFGMVGLMLHEILARYFSILEVKLYKDGEFQPIDYNFYAILVSYA